MWRVIAVAVALTAGCASERPTVSNENPCVDRYDQINAELSDGGAADLNEILKRLRETCG